MAMWKVESVLCSSLKSDGVALFTTHITLAKFEDTDFLELGFAFFY